jgi:hypothetical protein
MKRSSSKIAELVSWREEAEKGGSGSGSRAAVRLAS